jgi:Uma2 family endonuclease
MSITDLKTTGVPSLRPRPVHYPVSDGKPMAETDKHADQMTYHKEALRAYFAEREEVYVSGNNFIYYEEGNPRARVSPDCYVVFGIPQRQRDSYMVWLEGNHLPAVVFEFTSRKTKREDMEDKMALYEGLRIPEYFLFDPNGDYLRPRFQGFRLNSDNEYTVIGMNGRRMQSVELGLEMEVEGNFLRLIDPATNTPIPTRDELRRQAEQESAARRDAEAEIERLRAELEALRAGKTESSE